MTAGAAVSDADVPGAPDVEATRRRLTARQAEIVGNLVRAAEEETEAVGYDGLTVRNVARRAGVAPATAYTYFSSKDHLLAEVLWRRMEALPPVADDPSVPMAERMQVTIRDMIPFFGQSTALIDAYTVALISRSPDVAHLRDRIGALTHRRLAAALGTDVDPRVVRVLETSYSGALLAAGTGHRSFLDIPAFVADTAALLVAGTAAASPAGSPARKGARR